MEVTSAEMAEISVIIPVYMVEDYLEQALDSVLGQTFEDLEVILVIAYGQDRSEEICDAYAAQDKRIKLLKTEPLGNSDARNRGVAAATGRYIGFVDADDWVEPDMFATLYEQMQANKADIAACSFAWEWQNRSRNFSDDRPLQVWNTNQGLDAILYEKGFWVVLWNKLYKREMFHNVVFPVGKHFEDVAGTYRLIYNAAKITYYPVVKYHYRQRGSSQVRDGDISRKKDLLDAANDMLAFFKEHIPSLVYVAEYKYLEAIIDMLHIACQARESNKPLMKSLTREIWRKGKPFLHDARIPGDVKQRIILARLGPRLYRRIYLTALHRYRSNYQFY